MTEPQKDRIFAAKEHSRNIVEWVVLTPEQREIVQSPLIEDIEFEEVEPIIELTDQKFNEEGQTKKQWKRDLMKREFEEFLSQVPGTLVFVVVIGIGFFFQIVGLIFVTLLFLVKSLNYQSVSYYVPDKPTRRKTKAKSTINVTNNINVKGGADVNVVNNINVE